MGRVVCTPACAQVYSLAVQRLPAEHLLLWTLAAANGARQVEHFVRAQSAQHGGLAGGSKALAQQAAQVAWAAAADAIINRLPLGYGGNLATIPESDDEEGDVGDGGGVDEKRKSRATATNLLRDLPGRAVAVVGAAAGREVQQWLQALLNLLGGERLALALPLLGAMTPDTVSPEAASQRSAARSRLTTRGGPKAARASQANQQRAIASEDANASAARAGPNNDDDEELADGVLSPARDDEPRAPPGSPEAHDQDVRRAWRRVSALPRAARQRLVGAVTLRVRQWAPGGVVTLYDTVYDRLVYHAPAEPTLPGAFPPTGEEGAELTDDGTGAVSAAGSSGGGSKSGAAGSMQAGTAASGSFVAPGRPPSSPDETDATGREVPGAPEAPSAASAAATAAAEAEAQALGNRVAEVRRLGALEGMALVAAYRERLPSGGAFGFDLRRHPSTTNTATDSATEGAIVPLSGGAESEGYSFELERSSDLVPRAAPADEAPRQFFDSSSSSSTTTTATADSSSGLVEAKEQSNLLSPRSLKRMKRMMHYEVSVAPFSVTLELPDHGNGVGYDPSDLTELESSFSTRQRSGTSASASSSSSDHMMKLDSFGGQGSRSSSGEVVEDSSPSTGGEGGGSGSSASGSAPRKQSPSSAVASSVGTPGGSPSVGHPRSKARRKRKNRGGRRARDTGSGGGGSGGADSAGGGSGGGGEGTGTAGGGSSEKRASSVDNTGGAPAQASSSSTTTTASTQGGAGRSVRTVLCTPQSFPPSPMFRAVVLARSHGAADDVVYAARDALRRALQVNKKGDNLLGATQKFVSSNLEAELCFSEIQYAIVEFLCFCCILIIWYVSCILLVFLSPASHSLLHFSICS